MLIPMNLQVGALQKTIDEGMDVLQPQPQWDDLPVDLLCKISRSTRGTEGMRGVCRAWKVGLESTCTRLKCHIYPMPPNFVSRFQSLRELDLWEVLAPTPSQLKALKDLPFLTKMFLTLTWGELSREMSEVLQDIAIPELSLQLGCEADDDEGSNSMGLLEGLPLKLLEVRGADTSQAGLEPLRRLPLVDLFLGGRPVEGSDWGDVLEVVQGKPLESFGLGGCWVDVRKSSNKPFLYITDLSLEALWGMSLDFLDLLYCDQVSDEGLQFLRGMPLTILGIRCNETNQFTDAIFEILRSLPLEELDMDGCDSLTNAGFGVLRSVSSLAWLSLANTGFSDIGILQGLPLTHLDIAGTRVTDLGWGAFRGMPLKYLRLCGCNNLTGSGLIELEECPLKTLDVSEGCDSMDPVKVSEFWEANARFWGASQVGNPQDDDSDEAMRQLIYRMTIAWLDL